MSLEKGRKINSDSNYSLMLRTPHPTKPLKEYHHYKLAKSMRTKKEPAVRGQTDANPIKCVRRAKHFKEHEVYPWNPIDLSRMFAELGLKCLILRSSQRHAVI